MVTWQPFSGPLRAFRDRYVASFCGVSYDLAPRAVGVHPDHLQRVPELEGREVLVTRDHGVPGPLSRRPSFTVVSVEKGMKNAADIAESGGVVFSCFDLEDPSVGRILASLAVGEPVFLNSAADRLQGDVVKRWSPSAS